MLVLVCHTSERHRFAEHKLAHIATRISAQVTFAPATVEDTQQYLRELCEVAVDDGIIVKAHEEARGRYRLLASACLTLEAIASMHNKTQLALADVKGLALCEDAMRTLKKGVKA